VEQSPVHSHDEGKDPAPGKTIIFYDGDCGLCHGFVLFVLARDTAQDHGFVFAPLQGDTLRRSLRADIISELPDSIVVLTVERELLVRSSGVVWVLIQLRGPWKYVGKLLGTVPRVVRDFGYRVVASARRRVFKQPGGVCPIVSAELQGRFLT